MPISTDFTTSASTTAATSKDFAAACYFIQLLLLAVRLLAIIRTLLKPEQLQMILQPHFLSFRNFFSPSTTCPTFYVHIQYCSAAHSLFFKLFMYNFAVKNNFPLYVFL
jgi:hypothetical protein